MRLNPLRPLRRLKDLPDRYTRRSIAQTKSLVVRGYEAQRRMLLWSWVKMVVPFAAFMMVIWFPRAAWEPLMGMIVGWSLARGGLSVLGQAQAYRSGWLDGRHQAITAFTHSDSPQRWMMDLTMYDTVHVLGIAKPIIPDSPEGLE